jgi:NADH-ubiquinone oxidoreductase chain 1
VTPILLWLTFPVVSTHSFHALGLVYFLAIARIGVYGTLGRGWGSNSKYALLGALRAVAQTVSYEVRMTLILLGVIVFWTWDVHHEKQRVLALWLPVTFLIFTVSILAEANRSPFDFAEGESELVSGFNTEYRSTLFVMIFLAEYISIIFIRMICSFLFIITTFTELAVWATMVGSFYIWARGTLPRFRYDQLIYLAWKRFLPRALALLILAHLLFNCSQTLKVAPQKLR